MKARIIKIAPKSKNCAETDPAEGDMNCGKKAKKKSAVFGFIISTSADSYKIFPNFLRGAFGISEAVLFDVENKVLHPK